MADKYNISQQGMYWRLRQAGIPAVQVSGTAGRAEEIGRFLESGETLQRVGDRFGVSRERIRQIARDKLGITSIMAIRPIPDRRNTCLVCGDKYVGGTYTAHRTAVGHKFSRVRAAPKTMDLAEQVAKDYLDGVRIRDISDKWGIYPEWTFRLIRYAGVQPNRGGGKYVRTEEWRANARARALARWEGSGFGPNKR